MENKLSPALEQRLATASPGDRFEVQIFLRREPLSAWAATADGVKDDKELNRAIVINRVMEASAQSITGFLDHIALPPGAVEATAEKLPALNELCRHWINNSVSAEVSRGILQKILEIPHVEYVELVPHADIADLLHGPAEPLPASGLDALLTNPEIAKQVQLVKAPSLWHQGFRGGGVLVAVIDTGIDFGHPDLSNHKWDGGQNFPYHGFNFEFPNQPPSDERGHGTCSAGLIAGDGLSGELATGIAPEATLMALRVGELECQVWSAFQFAIEHEADVISMSMGWRADMNPNYIGWRRACEFLLKTGIVFVCSAGNTGRDEDVLHIPRNIGAPAICPPPWLHPEQHPGGLASAIACGETDLQDHLITASSQGPGAWEADPFIDYPFKNGGQGLLKPDLCGPGRDSMTCNPEFRIPGEPLHTSTSGTSAAAATVAGCAALLVQAAKRSGTPVLPQRIQQALEEKAVPIAGQTTKQNNLGSGRVDVFAAYQFGVQQGWW